MMTSRTLPASIAVLLLSLALMGCAHKTMTPPAQAAAVPVPVEAPPSPAAPEPASRPVSMPELRPAFFELDSYALTSNARAGLDADAAMLRTQTSMRVLIEGHCDERGTVEYNQALGERRARLSGSFGDRREPLPGHLVWQVASVRRWLGRERVGAKSARASRGVEPGPGGRRQPLSQSFNRGS